MLTVLLRNEWEKKLRSLMKTIANFVINGYSYLKQK